MSLKLGPLPDRTPVKLSLILTPDTRAALEDYAKIHAQEFGVEAKPAELAALMIEKFLESDTAFKRERKKFQQSHVT